MCDVPQWLPHGFLSIAVQLSIYLAGRAGHLVVVVLCKFTSIWSPPQPVIQNILGTLLVSLVSDIYSWLTIFFVG